MNLHKPKALHRFSERRLAGREWENAGERTNAEGERVPKVPAGRMRAAERCRVLNATSVRHVLNARSVERIGVCSTRLRAGWVRNRRGWKAEFGVCAARRFVLAHGRQASLPQTPVSSLQRRVNSCTKCPLPPRLWATLTHNWANAQCERGFICWNKLTFRRKCRKKNTSPCTTNLLRNS